MNEEEFSKLDLSAKWAHISTTMDYIVRMDDVYSMRRRLNPHHPEKYVKEEQRNLRLDQVQRWRHVMTLYSINRNEMANTLENDKYAECRTIIERVFTQEVDDALHNIINDDET